MWRINLRSTPPRPPPPFDPLVEAWLDSLPPPTTKPSLKELKQWRLNDYHGLGRNVFVTCLILRAISLAIAVSVTSIIASVVAERHGPFYAVERLVPLLVVVRTDADSRHVSGSDGADSACYSVLWLHFGT